MLFSVYGCRYYLRCLRCIVCVLTCSCFARCLFCGLVVIVCFVMKVGWFVLAVRAFVWRVSGLCTLFGQSCFDFV